MRKGVDMGLSKQNSALDLVWLKLETFGLLSRTNAFSKYKQYI